MDCSICGQSGASYCPTVDENYNPVDEYVHAFCAAQKAIKDGNAREAKAFSSRTKANGVSTYSFRGLGRIGVPWQPKSALHGLRLPAGSGGKPVSLSLR